MMIFVILGKEKQIKIPDCHFSDQCIFRIPTETSMHFEAAVS